MLVKSEKFGILIIPVHWLSRLDVTIWGNFPDRFWLCHADFGSVVYYCRLINVELDFRCGFKFFFVVSAEVEKSIHVVVIKKCREKIVFGEMIVVPSDFVNESLF